MPCSPGIIGRLIDAFLNHYYSTGVITHGLRVKGWEQLVAGHAPGQAVMDRARGQLAAKEDASVGPRSTLPTKRHCSTGAPLDSLALSPALHSICFSTLDVPCPGGGAEARSTPAPCQPACHAFQHLQPNP